MDIQVRYRGTGPWARCGVLAFTVVVAAGLAGFPVGGGHAQTLTEALAEVYRSNPVLETARASLRVVDEQLPQARANWRPTVIVNANAGVTRTSTDPRGGNNRTTLYNQPKTANLTITQPLFRGLRTVAESRRARDNIAAGRADLANAEQTVLLQGVQAYANVVREEALLALAINNESVIGQQLQAARDRFSVGELTRTDVAQAESRLARSVSDRINAQNNLETARAQFRNIVGLEPQNLQPPAPPDNLLPQTLEAAVAAATANNPVVLGADWRARSAGHDINLVRGELLPSLNLNGTVAYEHDASVRNGSRETASVVANLRIPLYQAGGVYSRVRAAKQTASQRIQERSAAIREAERAAADAWHRVAASRARVESFRTGVAAQQVALDGVNEEHRVGARAILDVLNAEQELVDSQIALVQAERDVIADSYNLLGAVGQLTARDLQLPVEIYDFDANLRRVRNKLFGAGIR